MLHVLNVKCYNYLLIYTITILNDDSSNSIYLIRFIIPSSQCH